MSSTSLLIALLLVVGTLSLRLEDLEVRREYRKGRPEMLWQRGLIPEYEDDPEVYRDTAWLMDKVITTRAEIQYEPIPPVVVYRHGNGEKQECINGKKTIPVQCQWTGWVLVNPQNSTSTPEKLKLSVAKKYCKAAGLTRPANKKVDC